MNQDFLLWRTYGVIMLGGALGTAARFWLSGFIAVRYGEIFPTGTLVINVLGSFIIGFFSGLTGPGGIVLASPLARQFVMVGILGGFTTFSSFSLQTVNLMSAGEWLYAGINIVGSVALCLLAAGAGLAMAAWIGAR